jgi:hypothetical protein
LPLAGLLAAAACEAAKVRPFVPPRTDGGSHNVAPPNPPPYGPMCFDPKDDETPIPCPDGGPPPPPPPAPRPPDAAPPAPRMDAGAPPSLPPPTPPPTPPPPPTADGPIKVRAWGATFTGVYLRKGETAQITATGRWRAFGGIEVGPEGRAPNYRGCPRGALVARIAKFHQRTCIRASGSITAARDGYVWLYQSEGWNAMQSTGEVEATITGGARNVDKWREGMTPISLDPRVDPARIQAFESVCGRAAIPIHFEAWDPTNPRVQAYVRDYFGGDPVAWISRAVVRGCALFYATPADFPMAYRTRKMRIVHYIRRDGDTPWGQLNKGMRGYWDFTLEKTLTEITSMQPDYGPYGGPPVSIMHEAGHVISPDGANGTLPKWLQETFAETLPSNIGDDLTGFHNAIDNPESIRFGATFWWCDGTFGGPSFVDWIDEQHPGFLHALTKASLALNKRPWPGSDMLFRQLTGRGLTDLWNGYADAYNFAEYKPGRPLSECMDPPE